MKAIQFLSSLVPSFKREDVSSAVDALNLSLSEETLPVYETAFNDLGSKGFNSRVGQEFEKEFARYVDTKFRGNSIEVTYFCLKSLQMGHMETLKSMVDKTFSRDIVVAGMTYKKTTVLQLIAQFDFAVTYARQNLLYLLAAEANVKAKSLPAGKERPAPEIKWLEDNRLGYFRMLGIMSLKRSEITQALDDIPDVVLTPENADITEQTLGLNKTDPLRLNLVPLGINPFYAIGIRYANWQVERNNRAKNEKRALEMRLEQLRLQRDGREDPVLEKRIAFYEDEINKLAAKIARFEG